jgi:hypothetical protein
MLLLIIPNKSSMMLNKKNHLTNDMDSRINEDEKWMNKDLLFENDQMRKKDLYNLYENRPKNVIMLIIVLI